MFRKSLFVCLLMVSACSASFAATDGTGKIDLTVNGSGTFYKDSTQSNAASMFGRLEYNLNPNWSLGAEVGHYFDSGVSGSGIDAGDLSGWSLFGDVLVKFPNESQLVPYALVGLGGIFWNFDESSSLKNAGITTSVGDSFAVKTGGGVDWFLNDNWALNLEVAYVFANSSATVSAGNVSLTSSGNIDHLLVGGGLKYRF